jgi:hypothetical protein
MIDIKKAAERLVCYLQLCGSSNESNISMDRDDHYKPMYRTIALFIAPTHPYIDEVLGGEKPTKEQAAEIMRMAHPYFAYVLDTEPDLFDSMWEWHRGAWEHLNGSSVP